MMAMRVMTSILLVALLPCVAPARPTVTAAFKFFVIGDWGRGANTNQRNVASFMGTVGDRLKPSYIISTGDNFYTNGLKMANDPYFKTTFTNVYTAKSLQVPWFAVLGNHDYGELSSSQVASCSAPTLAQCPVGCCYSPMWQMTNYTYPNMDTRWRSSQSSWKRTYLSGQLDIFFIDTTPLVNKYRTYNWANTWGGINSQDPTMEKAKIEAMLAASTAKWKLLVGHHPVFSYGSHCGGNNQWDCVDMQFLRPWLQKYKVAAYFSGHEHDLQLIKHDTDITHYVVSGAGSDIRNEDFSQAGTDAKYLVDQQGFVAVSVLLDKMTLDYWVPGNTTSPAFTTTVQQPV